MEWKDEEVTEEPPKAVSAPKDPPPPPPKEAEKVVADENFLERAKEKLAEVQKKKEDLKRPLS